jgi:hypothetical protein
MKFTLTPPILAGKRKGILLWGYMGVFLLSDIRFLRDFMPWWCISPAKNG